MAAIAEDGMNGRADRRAIWRDWSPAIALGVGFVGVIVSILAVGMAILGAVDRLRTDIDGVRTDLKAVIESVRTELKADIDDVRAELKADIDDLRNELRAEIRGVRTELKADIESVRTELKAEIRGARSGFEADIDDVRAEIQDLGTEQVETRERLARVEAQLDTRPGEQRPAGSGDAGE